MQKERCKLKTRYKHYYTLSKSNLLARCTTSTPSQRKLLFFASSGTSNAFVFIYTLSKLFSNDIILVLF